jgi:membrane protease YdiL (CAAX protease family)
MIASWNILAAAANEPDLLVQWPAFGISLLLLGLAADLFLLARWRQRRGVGAKPWGLSMLFAAGGINVAVILSVSVIGWLLRWKLTALLALLAATELALVAGLIACMRLEKIDWRQTFGVRNCDLLAAVGAGAVFFLAVLPPLKLIELILTPIYRALQIDMTPQSMVQWLLTTNSLPLKVVLAVFAVTAAPLWEETFFRGLAYPALKQRWGMAIAMTVTSLLFAVIHFHLPSLPLLLALAVGLTLAYEYTGSLLTPIAMHALFNLLNVVAILLYRAKP